MNYSCSKCGLAFQRNTPYKRHLKLHSKKEDNLCKECYTSFSREDSLYRHMKSHTADNVIHCQFCDETFATNHLLAKHIETHTNSHKEINNDNRQSVQNISLLENVYPKITHFKGFGFENPSRKNLCYINATVNSLLNCASFKNLINSEMICELIGEIQYSLNIKDGEYSTENIRTLLINHNKDQFKNDVQSDPDELMQSFFEISESLRKLFQFKTKYTLECKTPNCHEKSYNDNVVSCGLRENVQKERSISGIISSNRVTTVNSNCNRCTRNTDKTQTESFISLPEILMVTVKRFVQSELDKPGEYTKNNDNITPDREIILNNTKYILRSVIVHSGDRKDSGHYTASCIKGNGTWIECDDLNIRSSRLPLNGYIFLYEKSIAITYAKTRSTSNLSKTDNDLTQLNRHTRDRNNCCQFCNMTFCKNTELTTHLKTHSVENTYQCFICKQMFATNSDLLLHKKTHNGENIFKCNLCDQTFSNDSELKIHLNNHNSDKTYQCSQCDNTFSNKSEMLKHTMTHIDEELHKCRLCELSFSSEDDLKNHVITHIGGKVFQCNTCDKAFNSHSNLQSHVKRHNLDKPYKCSKCQKSFKTKKTLFTITKNTQERKHINVYFAIGTILQSQILHAI